MTLNEIVSEIQDGIATGRFTGNEQLQCEYDGDAATVDSIVRCGSNHVTVIAGDRI